MVLAKDSIEVKGYRLGHEIPGCQFTRNLAKVKQQCRLPIESYAGQPLKGGATSSYVETNSRKRLLASLSLTAAVDRIEKLPYPRIAPGTLADEQHERIVNLLTKKYGIPSEVITPAPNLRMSTWVAIVPADPLVSGVPYEQRLSVMTRWSQYTVSTHITLNSNAWREKWREQVKSKAKEDI